MARAKHTDNTDMKTALNGLSDDFLFCRDPGMRHPWQILNDFHVPAGQTYGKKVAELDRTLECPRCATTKTEHYRVTSYGLEKFRNSYAYPEGYLMPGIPRGVKPSILVASVQYERSMKRLAKVTRSLKVV